MTNMLNAVLVLLLVMNLAALGTSRILAVTHIVAAQGVLLGLIPLLVHDHLSIAVALTVILAVFIKAVVIPAIIIRALRDAQIKREVQPLIGLLPSIILGAIATAFALLFAGQLPLAKEHEGTLIVPTAISTVFVGFIILVTRYKAISQVIGYLILENGIFIFGMLLIEAMPLVVELGVLLDLFVGIFVACIIINHINQAFSSMDTRRLVSLKE
ncbi:MAG: hydrogenase [Anaerohalosphaeraceae bacterium]